MEGCALKVTLLGAWEKREGAGCLFVVERKARSYCLEASSQREGALHLQTNAGNLPVASKMNWSSKRAIVG